MTAASHRRLVTVALAALSAGAGAAHASITAEHAAVAWWYGGGFGLVAFLQVAWAVVLLRRAPSRRVLAAGAIGHAVVLGVWALARSADLPFIPAGGPSGVGVLDGTTALFEGLIVLRVLGTARATVRLRPWLQQAVGVSAAVVVLLTAPVTVVALAADPGHSHDSDPGHPQQPDHRHDAAHAH